MTAAQTSVLVVGGGPVGLTLSALLSGDGVDHVLVEAHRVTSRHPKARGVSARSMEIFRRIGLEEAVRGAGLPAEQVHFYRGRDLIDPDFVRTGLALQPDDGDEHTPSPGIICSQDALEPVLLRHARAVAGPRIRFGTRLVSFTDDGLGVLAVVEDMATGSECELRADWLVGCDGSASTVRAGAGIAMEGPTGLGRYLSIRFEAPLGQVVADRASASYFLTAPGRGGFMAVDNDRHWIYQYPLTPDTAPVDPPDHGRLAGLIRTAAGIPDLDVTIRDAMTWRMDAQLATGYRHSRVLLAGDAAHAIPPTGGHGMNTGIGDADNLAGSSRPLPPDTLAMPSWTPTRQNADLSPTRSSRSPPQTLKTAPATASTTNSSSPPPTVPPPSSPTPTPHPYPPHSTRTATAPAAGRDSAYPTSASPAAPQA